MLDGGPLIVLTLGAVVGVVIHLLSRRFWKATVIAAAAAVLLWVGGCYLLFAFNAPSELGLPALVPILLSLATALAASIVTGGAVRALGVKRRRE
jgi:hypothetical protein